MDITIGLSIQFLKIYMETEKGVNGTQKICDEIKFLLVQIKLLSSYVDLYPVHATIAEFISVCECTGLKTF